MTDRADATIRLATIGDAARIREIYNHEVLTSNATFDLIPRSPEEQEAWITERTGAFAAIVAVDPGGEVLGFGSLSPYKERAAYRTSVEDSVYVDRECHGRGVGRLIVTELLGVAALSGFHTVFARIEAGGTASRALHAACGFELVGVEREVGRKFHRWLDVAIMQKMV